VHPVRQTSISEWLKPTPFEVVEMINVPPRHPKLRPLARVAGQILASGFIARAEHA
jgi:hypothetical protein